MKITWMRENESKLAHAFTDIELSLGLYIVQSVGLCGPFNLADLVEDELAGRCAPCVRAAVRMARS